MSLSLDQNLNAILTRPEHGGPDGGAAITHDFSSNANPLGPPPEMAAAVLAADRQRYPDPHYRALRERLARWHGVAAARVLPTAGTSEAIRRLTLAAVSQGIRDVWLPQPGYGDYRAAALALGIGLGLRVHEYSDGDALLQALAAARAPALVWLCEPCNPTGRSLPAEFWSELAQLAERRQLMLAIDRAYEPLRLHGSDPVAPAVAQLAWQCFSPNKAFGLPGVRAGYLVGPDVADVAAGMNVDIMARIDALAPSWVLSAEGVALLHALPSASTQSWLVQSRRTLAQWAQAQRASLQALGWHCEASSVPFWLARPPPRPAPHSATLADALAELRDHGIKLRDASSFGRPGWVRVSAQPPVAQQALSRAWQCVTRAAA